MQKLSGLSFTEIPLTRDRRTWEDNIKVAI
jgi:hypothetical protein